jgi:hypothetical protein
VFDVRLAHPIQPLGLDQFDDPKEPRPYIDWQCVQFVIDQSVQRLDDPYYVSIAKKLSFSKASLLQ